jgi:hypothetical protein
LYELWRNACCSVAHRVCSSLVQTLSVGGEFVINYIIIDDNVGSFFEAGFYAGTVFYLTLFYKRNELGFRIALFFGSAELAAAFSGILAYGVFQIDNTALKGWQYLFIIE